MSPLSTTRLAGRSAFVTGGGRGLGAAICEALALTGVRVAVADIRADLGEAVVQRISDQGGHAMHCVLDVGDEEQATTSLRDAIERLGGLDILVNNAGTDVTLPLEQLETAQWDRVMATNLRGPFLLCREAVLHMKPRRSGHIVNITSTAAKRAWPNASAYHASKWGLLGLSHALHAELRPHGIKVTAAVVGGMRTPFLLERFPGIDLSTLQEPSTVAAAIVAVLSLPEESVVPEISVLPMRETSWP